MTRLSSGLIREGLWRVNATGWAGAAGGASKSAVQRPLMSLLYRRLMPKAPDQPRAGPAAFAPGRPRWLRFLPLALVVVGMVVVFATGLYQQISLEAVIRHRAAIDALIKAHFAWAIAIYLGVLIATAALSIPTASFLAISSGLLFGTAVGTAATVVGATIGASILFLITRTAFGDWLLMRAGPQAARITVGFRADAFSYLLFLRLVPLFPFTLVNLVAGFGGIRLTPFVAATLIGIIPLTTIFVLFGAGLDSAISGPAAAYRKCMADGLPNCSLDIDISTAATPQLIAAMAGLCLIALTPVIVKRFRAARRTQSSPP